MADFFLAGSFPLDSLLNLVHFEGFARARHPLSDDLAGEGGKGGEGILDGPVPKEERNKMKAIAEVQIIPLGAGVSVRKEVMRAHELLEESGLEITLHANGSNMEGELEEVLDTIGRTINTLHEEGVVRLSSHIKIGTRTDKVPTLAGKLFK
ncbi:MTH1187 family thiamine-binding protein [Gemmatimonadota bacterium]